MTLLVVLHVASGPLMLCTFRDLGLMSRYPVLWDVVRVVYAPGIYWYDHPELPAHDAYVSYCNWAVGIVTAFWSRW